MAGNASDEDDEAAGGAAGAAEGGPKRAGRWQQQPAPGVPVVVAADGSLELDVNFFLPRGGAQTAAVRQPFPSPPPPPRARSFSLTAEPPAGPTPTVLPATNTPKVTPAAPDAFPRLAGLSLPPDLGVGLALDTASLVDVPSIAASRSRTRSAAGHGPPAPRVNSLDRAALYQISAAALRMRPAPYPPASTRPLASPSAPAASDPPAPPATLRTSPAALLSASFPGTQLQTSPQPTSPAFSFFPAIQPPDPSGFPGSAWWAQPSGRTAPGSSPSAAASSSFTFPGARTCPACLARVPADEFERHRAAHQQQPRGGDGGHACPFAGCGARFATAEGMGAHYAAAHRR
ncbi:hypothetical protein DFJ74DRAFT_771664 [Hyaloraphidium curvatum]|nr:hypothetical protein DFJ74DRAFT_771664 [Hyaloraphidium curvatum]